MATYTELYNLRIGEDLLPLRRKIDIALAIRANEIAKIPTATAAQKQFAVQALKDSSAYSSLILSYILAEYNTATVVAITGATDAQVQAAVNAAIGTLIEA